MRHIILLILSITTTVTYAQTSRALYFSEKSPLRHELNASFAPESGYISIPLMGNINISTKGNFSLSSIFFPSSTSNQLNLFMNSQVDADQFLNNINQTSSFDSSLSFDILAGGFWKWGGFNTISLKSKSYLSMSIPKEMFEFLKLGMESSSGSYYNFEDLSMSASSVLEAAFGHSKETSIEGLRVGAKMKLLFGIVNAYTHFDSFNASLSQDEWVINNSGYIVMNGVDPSFDSSGEFNGIDKISPGIHGFGMAIDFGASYKIKENLNVSFAVNDLGFMKWMNNNTITSNETFKFTGFEDIDITGDIDKSIEDQTDALGDDLDALFSYVSNKGDVEVKSLYHTRPTINIGADIGICENKITFGLLWTTQFNSNYIWTDIMGSVNFRPANCLNIGLNGSASNMGHTFGAMINLCAKRFNWFVSANAMSLKIADGSLPLPIGGLTYQASLGFSVMLAKNRED